MTTAEFQAQFPKPWRFVVNVRSFALRAANNKIVATLAFYPKPRDVPQKEWNRQVAAAMEQYIPCVTEEAENRAERLRRHDDTIAP